MDLYDPKTSGPVDVRQFMTGKPAGPVDVRQFISGEPEETQEPSWLKKTWAAVTHPTQVTEQGKDPWIMRHPVAHFLYEGTLGNIARMQQGMFAAAEQMQIKGAGGFEQRGKMQPALGKKAWTEQGPLSAFAKAMRGQEIAPGYTGPRYRDLMRNAGVKFGEDLNSEAAYKPWYSLKWMGQLGLEYSHAVGEFGTDPLVLYGGAMGRVNQIRTVRAVNGAKANIFQALMEKGVPSKEAAIQADNIVNGGLTWAVDPKVRSIRMVVEEGAKGTVASPLERGLLNNLLLKMRGGRYATPSPGKIDQMGRAVAAIIRQDQNARPLLRGVTPSGQPPAGAVPSTYVKWRSPRMSRAGGVEAAQRTVQQTGPIVQPQAPGAQPAAITEPARSAQAVVESRILAQEGLELGGETKVIGTKGQAFPARYAAVPRAQIQASHSGESFARNPQYALENARDYSQSGEQEKVITVRNAFDPARHVTDSPDAAVGPVIVANVTDEEGISRLTVLGGNNREMAIATMGPGKQAELYNFTNARIGQYGLNPLQSPDHELVRFMGDFDLRAKGQRADLQRIIDALNPSPGKVQNMAEMAALDAQNNVPMEALSGMDMNIGPGPAQEFVAAQIREGKVDRNLRGQLAEQPAQAQEYTRRLLANAAFKSPALAEFRATTSVKDLPAKGLVESAVPALISMRTRGMDQLADGISQAMGRVVEYWGKTQNLDGALEFAAQQLEMDPAMAVVNDVAQGLRGRVVRSAKGRLQTEETLEKFEEFWGGLDRAVQAWQETPDLFGEVVKPQEVIRAAIRYQDQMLEAAAEPADRLMAAEAPASYGTEKPTGAMAYATGQWPDAKRTGKPFDNGKLRVFSAEREGKPIYETQLHWEGAWHTVQYAGDEAAAKTLPERHIDFGMESWIRAARKEPWYRQLAEQVGQEPGARAAVKEAAALYSKAESVAMHHDRSLRVNKLRHKLSAGGLSEAEQHELRVVEAILAEDFRHFITRMRDPAEYAAIGREEEASLIRQQYAELWDQATHQVWRAKAKLPAFRAMVEAAAAQVPGSKAVAQTKSVLSIVRKIVRQRTMKGQPDAQAKDLWDTLRGAVITAEWDQVPTQYQAVLAQAPQWRAEIFLTRARYNDGYRAIHLNTHMDEVRSEVQVHPETAWKLKLEWEWVYEKWRDVPKETREHDPQFQADMDAQREVWENLAGTIPDSVKAWASPLETGILSIKSPYVPPVSGAQALAAGSQTSLAAPGPSGTSRASLPSGSSVNLVSRGMTEPPHLSALQLAQPGVSVNTESGRVAPPAPGVREAVQQYLQLEQITDPAHQAGAAQLIQGVHNELAQKGTKPQLPIDQVAGQGAQPARVRGSKAARKRKSGLGAGAEAAPRGARGDLQRIEQQRNTGIFLQDPELHGPEIRAALDEQGRISSIIPELISGKLPAFEVAGTVVKDLTDWALLNLTLRSPYAESMKLAAVNRNGRITHAQIHTVGVEDASLVSRTAVLRFIEEARAITGSEPAYLFMAHNHPSGDPSPSAEDLRLHRTIREMVDRASNGKTKLKNIVTQGEHFVDMETLSLVPLPEAEAASWEIVPRKALRQIHAPMELADLAAAIKATEADGWHVYYLNTKNRITGIEYLPPGLFTHGEILQEARLVKSLAWKIATQAGREGAKRILVSMKGGQENLTALRAVRRELEAADVDLLDVLDGQNRSWRENGVMSFASAEAPASYRAGPEDLVARETTGSYDFEAKAFDPAAALAVEIPAADRGKVDLAGWQVERLGGLEHVKPLYMPELVRLVKTLGATPKVKDVANGLGYFRGKAGSPNIVLDRRLFRDPRQAAQVLGHYLGNLADWLPDETLKRGNLVGHLLALRNYMKNTYGPFQVTNTKLRDELLTVSDWWRPYDPKRVSPWYQKQRHSATQLYGDAVSILLNAPAELKRRAPLFWSEFFKHMDRRPEVQAGFLELWDFVNRPEAEVLRSRSKQVQNMFVKGEEILLRKARERELRHGSLRGWWDRVKFQYGSEFGPAVEKAAALEKKGVRLRWDENPAYLWDEHPLGDNGAYLLMQRTWENVVKPLEEQGFNLGTLGEYLFHNRILNERYSFAGELSGRSVLANSQGITPNEARSQLLLMRLTLGMDKMTLLEDAARRFQDSIYQVVEQAVHAGVIGREIFEQLIKPNKYNYATFATLDGLERSDYVPAGIRAQHGTLSDIANPFHLSLMKAISMVRVSQWYHNVNATVGMFVKHFPEEISQAPVHWKEGRLVPERPPEGKAQIMSMSDGKPVWWNVEPLVAEMLEHTTPGRGSAIVTGLNLLFRKIAYPMWVKYAPRFHMLTNPIRDFRRTARNLPAGAGGPYGSMVKLAKYYAKTWRSAVNRAQGRTDPLLTAMMENWAIGTPFDTFVANAYRDDYFAAMLRRFHLMPEAEQEWWTKNVLGRGLDRMLNWITHVGQIVETLPKTSTYRITTEELGWEPRKAAHWVRNYFGTPHWQKRGRDAHTGGTIFPFINVFLRGWQADLQLMTKPNTRGAWWYKWAATNGLSTLLKALAKVGVLGAGLKSIYDGFSDYNNSNYETVPLGTVTGGEFGKKAFGLRIPKDETARILDGIVYKVLVGALSSDDELLTWRKWTDLLSYAGGQLPGLNPFLTIPSGWATYMSGQNPMDYFRNSPILANDEWLAGGWTGARGMLSWTAQELGVQNFIKYDPNADSTLEFTLSAVPVANSLFMVSDYGYREKQRRVDEALDRDKARLRLMLSDNVRKDLRDYRRLAQIAKEQRTPQQMDRYLHLSVWYRTVFSPTFEQMLDYHEAGKNARVKQLARELDPAD